MNAIWSFWSKPYRESKSLEWYDEVSRFCSWKLSLELAKKKFPQTILFTDNYGKKILIDELGLEFDLVSTDLNALDELDSKWWALGKLYTYLYQSEPFLHIDSDVYLHNMFDEKILTAPLIAQNYEYFNIHESWYHPRKFEIIKNINGYLPKEIAWYINEGHDQKALCCGIFGGNDLKFIKHYSTVVFDVFLHPTNHPRWIFLGGDNILLEQYVLSACIEYAYSHPDSIFYKKINIECLFDSSSSAFDPEMAKKCGFTHLIGGAKKDSLICGRLKKRISEEYPDFYLRCIKHATSCLF
jgi:hypothetical protein